MKSHVTIFLFVFLITKALVAFSSPKSSWLARTQLGYSTYEGMYSQDRYFGLLRFSLGKEFSISTINALALELGVQTGSTMRLNLPSEVIDQFGGVPVKVTIKPIFDILLSKKISVTSSIGVIGKVGGAFRAWQFDGCAVDNKNSINPELQFGLNYEPNKSYAIDLSYQIIFGKNFSYSVNPLTEKISLSGITSQHSLLIGVSIMLDRITTK